MAKQTSELERIAGLTKDDAHDELISRVRAESVRDEAQILRESEQNVRAQADKTAREIISTAIQRCATDQAGEITVTSVHIPSDDLKGRIIGREGRNIRTFEQVSGVSLVIDDTPETVILSSFDPARRETARVALENLIADGRIHPARIEELYKKAEDLVNERVREAGEQAAFDAGIHDLHPELVRTLGALRYRTSFGQNVLQHSIQVSALCGIMASELGLDEAPAKRAGLLHDLGKAIDHEVEGPHAVIGADLARRYGERPGDRARHRGHHADVDRHRARRPWSRPPTPSRRPSGRPPRVCRELHQAPREARGDLQRPRGRRAHLCHAGWSRAARHGRAQKISTPRCHRSRPRHRQDRSRTRWEYPGQVRVVVIRESRALGIAK